jgi:eukaryotic-like serine/threonine-protein kinase
MIRLQLLGSIDLRDERGAELRSVLAQPKRLALLAYLAAASPPGPQRRDTLLGLFWPELDDEHARNALSKAVHFLRRSLGEDAIVSRSSEELALDSTVVWADVRAFGTALEEGRVDEALEFYQGDLLPSFFIQEAAGFEEWLERERARLRSLAAAAARLLAERHEAGRHLTLAVASARRAVELSNGDERQLRRLVELLDRLGDRAGALRAYEDFARKLASELEIDPDPETVALIDRVRATPPRPAAPRLEQVASIPSESAINRLSKAVASRYKIERQLGAGAMAVVALAHDLRHHRRVAIKILRPELSSLMGPERFLREIDIAASLMHPHILPLHDSGEADGLLYYVMPYVEGESLRGRLDRERRLPLDDALQIGREVADALGYAHHRGFIHRDIKPENILLGGGHALVADFGIARALDSVGAQLSTKGLGTGTPAYMSPEQVTGENPVDERTDIYALGCVLHEMLSGEPPFIGVTPEEILAHRLGHSPRRLSSVRKDIVPELDLTIGKALARNPSDRFRKASELGEALSASEPNRLPARSTRYRLKRWAAVTVPAAVTVAVLALLLADDVDLGARTATVSETTSSVAVLPIDNLSGDPTKAYLADGLTAELIDKLFRLEGLRIPSSGTVARYRGGRLDPVQVGRELGVNAVVTGSVSQVSGKPRVALQLVNAADGFVRWSGVYDQGDPTVEADIASVLAESLRVQLRLTGIVQTRSSTRDTAAYRLYLQGRHLVNQVGRESVREGLGALEQAIARDSGFADAWAALPVAYGLLGQLGGLTPAESQLLQRRAVERAISLDSLSGEAYSARAHVRVQYEWDYPGADRDYRRALQLTPGSALNHMRYSQFLGVVGLDDSSLAVMRRGLALDPTASWLIANHSYALLKVGRAREALAEAERALRVDSTQWVAYHLRAWAYKQLGQPDRTLADLKQALQIVGDTVPFLLGPIGEQLALLGHRAEAETVLARLERLDAAEDAWISRVRLALGDRTGALDALERSARNREGWLSEMLASGNVDALRGEPRYEAVLRRVGITKVRTRK